MMLFNFIVLFLSLLWGAGMVVCWRMGFRDGIAAGKNEPLDRIIYPAAKREKTTPEQARLDNILANIDAYDGTERGQREVEP